MFIKYLFTLNFNLFFYFLLFLLFLFNNIFVKFYRVFIYKKIITKKTLSKIMVVLSMCSD